MTTVKGKKSLTIYKKLEEDTTVGLTWEPQNDLYITN